MAAQVNHPATTSDLFDELRSGSKVEAEIDSSPGPLKAQPQKVALGLKIKSFHRKLLAKLVLPRQWSSEQYADRRPRLAGLQ